MKLKIKFTSAALAMTLLAMAGTAEAAIPLQHGMAGHGFADLGNRFR